MGQIAANLYWYVGGSARPTHGFEKGKLRGIIVTVQKKKKKIKISSIIHKHSTKQGENACKRKEELRYLGEECLQV